MIKHYRQHNVDEMFVRYFIGMFESSKKKQIFPVIFACLYANAHRMTRIYDKKKNK